MSEERFMKLVEEQQGFEYYQAYKEDVDHVLGGKGDSCWYLIAKEGKVKEVFFATCRDGVWSDRHIKGRGARKTEEEIAPGTTIRRIEEKAYLMQEEKWVKDRKPKAIRDAHPHYHYTYGFGDKGLDVSEAYGVTIGFNDLSDPEAGFHLRYLYTGGDVEIPKL